MLPKRRLMLILATVLVVLGVHWLVTGKERPGKGRPAMSLGFWSGDRVREFPPLHANDWTERPADVQPGRAEPIVKERFESIEGWLDTEDMDASATTEMYRPLPPSREAYSDMRQSIPGYFGRGSDSIFLMLKTGADTLWERTSLHFLTTITRFVHFKIYSDTAASMFGYEVVDILRDIDTRVPSDVSQRHRAFKQMHDEAWGWLPSKVDGNGGGGWALDRFKNIPILQDAYRQNPNCEWYIMMDDDSYVFFDNLVRFLGTKDPQKMLYMGNPGNDWLDGEWFPFAHGGSLIVVSQGLASALVGNERDLSRWQQKAVTHCCGDAVFGETILGELRVKMEDTGAFNHHLVGYGGPFQANNIPGVVIHKDRFCMPIITWHHLEGHDYEVLYEYERKWEKDRFITYDDIYRDFFLPWVAEERANWVLTTDHTEKYFQRVESDPEQKDFKLWSGDRDWFPGNSKDECKASCESVETCAAWSYKPGESGNLNECLHSAVGFSMGQAANAWNGKTGWTTGWLLERIRSWRAGSSCDFLEHGDDGWNDDADTSEGWALRKLGLA